MSIVGALSPEYGGKSGHRDKLDHSRVASSKAAWFWTVLSLVAASYMALEGAFVRGIRCSTACNEPTGRWYDDSDSWQWDGQLIVLILASAALVAGTRLCLRRHPGGLPLVLLAIAVFGGWVFTVARHASLG